MKKQLNPNSSQRRTGLITIKIRAALMIAAVFATLSVPASAGILKGVSIVGGNWDGTTFSASPQNGWLTYFYDSAYVSLFIETDFDSDWTDGLLNTLPPPNTIPATGVPINGPVFNARMSGDGLLNQGPLNIPSDPYYALLLIDGDDNIIQAIYNTPQPVGLGIVSLLDLSDQFDLLNFSWIRPQQLGAPAVDYVSGFAPTPGDSSSDYVGLLSIRVVPEPSTFVLSTLGLLLLGVAARRKNSRLV